MKKCAIMVASILFIAGCTTNRSGHQSSSMSGYDSQPSEMSQRDFVTDPSISAQHDPAMSGVGSSASGSSSHISEDSGLQSSPDNDMVDKGTHFQYEHPLREDLQQNESDAWTWDNSFLRGSANWNPSDDLLPDGVESTSDLKDFPDRNNDASVGGAASSESGRGSSKSEESKDLNASSNLERNISGNYKLELERGRNLQDLKNVKPEEK